VKLLGKPIKSKEKGDGKNTAETSNIFHRHFGLFRWILLQFHRPQSCLKALHRHSLQADTSMNLEA